MMLTPYVNPEWLPQSVIELIDVIGLKAALTIVEERGGTSLCVPVKVNNDHWLAAKIGLEAFQSLVNIYQGMEIEIPRCHAALKALQDHEIHASAEAGKTNGELARRYGMTERNIRKIKSRVKESQSGLCSLQQDLF